MMTKFDPEQTDAKELVGKMIRTAPDINGTVMKVGYVKQGEHMLPWDDPIEYNSPYYTTFGYRALLKEPDGQFIQVWLVPDHTYILVGDKNE